MWFDVVLALSLLQSPQAAGPAIEIALVPRSPDAKSSLRWSPKGASVALAGGDDGLVGAFSLGDPGLGTIAVRLSSSEGSEHVDVLEIDLDRDGAFAPSERLTTTPRETRAKWWSSFEATVPIPMPPDADGAPTPARAYPIALWFVAGDFRLGGAPGHIAIARRRDRESERDQRDHH